MKRVVVFGQSDMTEEATRNSILCKAFADNSEHFIDCTIRFGFAQPGAAPMFKIFYGLLFVPLRWVCLSIKYFSLPEHDVVFVPYPSYIDGWLGCLLSKIKNKKVIIDAFLGVYDTIIRDRELFKKNTIVARIIWKYEAKLMSTADYLLVDTKLNGKMLQLDYCLPDSKMKSIPIGIDENLWIPTDFKLQNKFKVVFWCTFIPLHGAEVVAKAAEIVGKQFPQIEFIVIGTGQLAKKFAQLIGDLHLNNLKWDNRFIALHKIQKYVNEAHCCLGIFGDNNKSQRVIPYKIYQSLASAKPVITARTVSSETLFTHRKDAYLVNPIDPDDLAKAILWFYKNPELASNIGKNGLRLYASKLSCKVINKKIKELLE